MIRVSILFINLGNGHLSDAKNYGANVDLSWDGGAGYVESPG